MSRPSHALSAHAYTAIVSVRRLGLQSRCLAITASSPWVKAYRLSASGVHRIARKDHEMTMKLPENRYDFSAVKVYILPPEHAPAPAVSPCTVSSPDVSHELGVVLQTARTCDGLLQHHSLPHGRGSSISGCQWRIAFKLLSTSRIEVTLRRRKRDLMFGAYTGNAPLNCAPGNSHRRYRNNPLDTTRGRK